MTTPQNSREKAHASKCNNNPCVCDGHHTFDELYDHRIRLFIALCRAHEELHARSEDHTMGVPWCSKLHSDGTSFDGWFILGIGKRRGRQITYHLPDSYWDEVIKFAEVLPKAPKFDGHTSDDVLKRLKRL